MLLNLFLSHLSLMGASKSACRILDAKAFFDRLTFGLRAVVHNGDHL